MELRLQQFIEATETLADIRNLDTFNPIVFQLEHPVTATRYTIVGAKVEPSYLGLPVNTTWVVLDPLSPYYRMALKLMDHKDPDNSTTLPPVQLDYDINNDGVIDSGDALYWNIVRTYDEIFADPQYYVTGGRGPKGDKGDKGDPGVVDYNTILVNLNNLTGTLSLSGPDTVNSNGTAQYTVFLSESQILDDGTITPPETRQVTAPIYLLGPVPQGTYMDAQNVLHTGQLTQDTTITLHTTYPSWARNVTADKSVLLKAPVVQLTGIYLSGPSQVNSGSTAQYTVVATWDDGSTTYPDGTWALDSTNYGTISQTGLLTVPSDIASSGSVNVSCTVVINGVTFTPNQTVIVTKVTQQATVTSISISGPTAVDSGTTAQYTLVVNWSDGTVTNPTPIWSLNSSLFGSISASGLLTVPSNISSSGTVVVTGTITLNGTQYQPTLSVNVTKIAVPPTLVSVVISGPTIVYSGSSAVYTIVANWSDGSTTNPAGLWFATNVGTMSPSYGIMASSGTYTVPADLAADGQDTIHAAVTIDDHEYNPTLVVTAKVMTVTDLAPMYGTGPALPSDWTAFVNGLTPYPSLTSDGKYMLSIDCFGSDTYLYFAYPASHGSATFFDTISQFTGGFGGAGNPGVGPSAASLANYTDMPVQQDITINGNVVTFYIYRSDFPNLGSAAANRYEVTLTTP